jgi:hypothetical protein
LQDAQDVAAVLHSRIATAIAREAGAGRSRMTPRLVVGLIPKAVGPMTAEMRQALDKRSDRIEARASAVLDEALLGGDTWTRELGRLPHRKVPSRWRQQACTVAAYRDRYGIVGANALGPVPETVAQRRDAASARTALAAAKRLADERDASAILHPTVRVVPSPSGIRL